MYTVGVLVPDATPCAGAAPHGYLTRLEKRSYIHKFLRRYASRMREKYEGKQPSIMKTQFDTYYKTVCSVIK